MVLAYFGETERKSFKQSFPIKRGTGNLGVCYDLSFVSNIAVTFPFCSTGLLQIKEGFEKGIKEAIDDYDTDKSKRKAIDKLQENVCKRHAP